MNIRKLLWAIAGTLAYGLQAALSDDHLSTMEVTGLTGMVLAAFGTWLIPNTPLLAAAKTWVVALVIGTGVLEPLLADGLQVSDAWPTLIAILTAAGVYQMPKDSTPAVRG